MAFYSGFFNSKGLDRTYTAEDFTSYLSSIICDGILDTYGQSFKLRAASSGLGVLLGTGKAWIDGHYFINDAPYSINLGPYQDESLPRYVTISILLDVGESVRSVSLEVIAGTPAENPLLPALPSDENKTRLLMYAVRVNPGVTRLTEDDWTDYRDDKYKCGYCKCILGKCKVTDMQAQLAQILADMEQYQDTVDDLENRIAELEAEIEDIGDIVETGKCGENIFYALYSTGRLVLHGSGEMYDYEWPDSDTTNQSPFKDNQNIKRVIVSSGITSIGTYAFHYCDEIESTSLPSTLTSVGRFGFYPHPDNMATPTTAKGLKSLTIPSSVTEIGNVAFCGTRIEEVTVPVTVIAMGERVFSRCVFLTKARFEAAEIPQYTFVECTHLTDLTLARTVRKIGSHWINYCSRLTELKYEGSLADWAAVTKGQHWDGHGGVLPGSLEKVICLDGYLQYDSENNEWVEVRD